MLTKLQPVLEKLTPYTHRLGLWLNKVLVRLFRFLQVVLQQITRFTNWLLSLDLPINAFQGILILFVIFSLIYAWATPIFEASDELWHFGMVEYISQNHDLPLQTPGQKTSWQQEGSQPPLYYAISAALISPFDLNDIEAMRLLNPHARAGIPREMGNKNLILHDSPYPVLRGTTLAVFVARIFGVVLGCFTISAVYASARLMFPKRQITALLAMGLTAFNPMFIFITASVNNDNLVTALNSVVIYLTLRTMRDSLNTKHSLLMSLLIALGTLSKISAWVLIPVVIVTSIWVARRDKNWRGLAILISAMAIFWAIIAGWWYIRNVQLYGEFFGTNIMAAVAGMRDEPFTLQTLINEFYGFRVAYWGWFGALNIQLADTFYTLMDFVALFSVFGLIFAILQLASIRDFSFARRELTYIAVLVIITIIAMAAVIAWTRQTYASQGRLLFPFVGAMNPLLAFGLIEFIWWVTFLLRPPDDLSVPGMEIVPEKSLFHTGLWPVRFLGFIALLIPFVVIRPHYTPPGPIEALPDTAHQIYARYDDVALIGYDMEDRRYQPGGTVTFTFYWQVLEQSDQDNSISITLLNPEGEEIGKVDTYPGAGTLRTSKWEAGKIYPDTYNVPIFGTARGRYPMRVQVGWWHYPTDTDIAIVNDANEPIEAVLLNAGALVSSRPNLMINERSVLEQPVSFDNQISLIDYDYRDGHLRLLWETLTDAPKADYTVFAQVYDKQGNLLAQDDNAPSLPTHYWRWAERFITEHTLKIDETLKFDEFTIIVGWYDPATEELTRLPIGEEYPDAAFPLPAVEFLEETPEATAEATVESTSEATAEVAAEITPDE